MITEAFLHYVGEVKLKARPITLLYSADNILVDRNMSHTVFPRSPGPLWTFSQNPNSDSDIAHENVLINWS